MSKTLLSTIVAVALAAPAFASDASCDSPAQSQWKAKEDVIKILTDQGFDVKRIKAEKGCYEAYAVDASGARGEILVDPMTGELVGSENE